MKDPPLDGKSCAHISSALSTRHQAIHRSVFPLCFISELTSRDPGYLEDQLEDIVRNIEAASAGLLDQVEGLSELEGLGLVTVDLDLDEQIVSCYIFAIDRLLVFSPGFPLPWRSSLAFRSNKTYNNKSSHLDQDSAVAKAGHRVDGVGLVLDILERKVLYRCSVQ